MCTECKVGILAQRGWGQPLQGGGGGREVPRGLSREDRHCGFCFREGFTGWRGPAQPASPSPAKNAPPVAGVHRCVTLLQKPPRLPSQPGKGGPPIPTPTRCGRPWRTLLRTSPPPCPRSGGGPLCCTPGLGQTGSPGRLWRAWRCALAPHSFSGRPGPLSQSWRLARRHQERRRREALLGGAATLRIRLWTDGGGWDRGAPAAQEGQEEHRVRLSLGRAGLHL